MAVEIQCPRHGNQPVAYTCSHLVGPDPSGVVVGGDPLAAAAVCATCDARVEGDWSRLGPQDMEVACALCFGEHVAGAQDLSGLPEPAELFTTACTQMIQRNTGFVESVRHDALSGWQITPEHRLELLDAEGASRVSCECDHVGSFDPKTGAWMWAWANDSLPPGVRARASVPRALGERLGLPVLGVPVVEGIQLDAAWHLAQLGGWLAGSRATYQVEADGLQVFLAIGRWDAVEAA